MNKINNITIIDYDDILIKEITNNRKLKIKQLNAMLIKLRKKYKIKLKNNSY